MKQSQRCSIPIRHFFFSSLSLAFVSALMLPFCSPSFAADQQTTHSLENYLKRLGYNSIPLKYDHGNHLMFDGQIDGKNHDFMVDTGCTVTTIDSSIARKLKTLKTLGVQLKDPVLGIITNEDFRLATLKLGSAIFTNQPAASKTLDLGGHTDTDCLLGFDFLLRNFCLIDCTGHKLYVRATEPPEQVQKALEESLRRSGFHEIKLRSSDALIPTLTGGVNSKPVKLLLDTGAAFTTIDYKQATRLGIEKQFTRTRVSGIGKIGTAWLDRTKLKSLEMGDLSFKNLETCIADLSGWKIGDSNQALGDVDGILGPDTLAYNRALIDCHGLKLWLQP